MTDKENAHKMFLLLVFFLSSQMLEWYWIFHIMIILMSPNLSKYPRYQYRFYRVDILLWFLKPHYSKQFDIFERIFTQPDIKIIFKRNIQYFFDLFFNAWFLFWLFWVFNEKKTVCIDLPAARIFSTHFRHSVTGWLNGCVCSTICWC